MKGKRKRLWRKMCKDTTSLGAWSRMLHKWWRLDISKKEEFDKKKIIDFCNAMLYNIEELFGMSTI
jgi:hypothetical protein